MDAADIAFHHLFYEQGQVFKKGGFIEFRLQIHALKIRNSPGDRA
jgi:hypothetical protein